MKTKIEIAGKTVRLKSNGLFTVKYKSEFGREVLKDLNGLMKFENATTEDIANFNWDALYDIIWTLAWFADRTIPDRDEWLLSFDDFDVFDLDIAKILELVAVSITGTKKKNLSDKKTAKK